VNWYQVDLTLRGLEIAAAQLNGNAAERDALVERFIDMYEFGWLAEAFTYAAVLGVEMAVPARAAPFEAVLEAVTADVDAVLLPDMPVRWQEAVWLAAAVGQGGGVPQAAASTMDQPGAVNGTFQLMISSFHTLTRVPQLPRKTAAGWAELMRDSFAAGAGVEDDPEEDQRPDT